MAASILVKRISAIFLMVSMVLSCRVTLVPEYNAQLEEQIAKTAGA